MVRVTFTLDALRIGVCIRSCGSLKLIGVKVGGMLSTGVVMVCEKVNHDLPKKIGKAALTV